MNGRKWAGCRWTAVAVVVSTLILQLSLASSAAAETTCADAPFEVVCNVPMLGAVMCTVNPDQYCGAYPNTRPLCIPDVSAFFAEFCAGLQLYGDCDQAMLNVLNNGKACCVDSCANCTATTNCGTP